MYFIKKLGHQELGSGKGARGRYILVSKKATKMFPPLGTTVTNDFFQLQIYSEHSKNRGVFCYFVYHNDKHTKAKARGRDEYRIYLNKGIDPNRDYFKSGDIIVLRLKDSKNYIYQLDLLKESDNNYEKIDTILKSNSITPKKSMGLVEKNDEVEKIIKNRNIVNEDNPLLLDDVVNKVKSNILSSLEEFESQKGANLFNESQFRSFIMHAYKKCALTKKIIKWGDYCNLEAAHIKPRAHEGSNLPCNGIGFSRDVHWAFDKGFFTINDDYTIKIHKDLNSDFFMEYDGKKLIVPDDSFFKPDPRYLKHHRENIFGLFKKSGKISKL